MDDMLKLGENLFKFELAEEVCKEKTFVRLDDNDGEVCLNIRFKLKTIAQESIPAGEEENYRKPIASGNSLLVDNAYTTGKVVLSHIDGTTGEIALTLQIASKQPPWGAE